MIYIICRPISLHPIAAFTSSESVHLWLAEYREKTTRYFDEPATVVVLRCENDSDVITVVTDDFKNDV